MTFWDFVNAHPWGSFGAIMVLAIIIESTVNTALRVSAYKSALRASEKQKEKP